MLWCSVATARADGFVQGILLDKTSSMQGQEFFSKFSLKWNQISLSKRVNVTVTEAHSPRKGRSVAVYVEENLVFQVPLTPRKPVDESRVDAAKNAAARAARSPRKTTLY